MITFEVGKIYHSRDNKHRRILVVGRTPCFIKVQYIVDGNHAIDNTVRLKTRSTLGNSGEMVFDATDTYHAASEVTERPAVAEVSMEADDVVKSDTAEFTTENPVSSEPVKFEQGKCYWSTDKTTKVLCDGRDSGPGIILWRVSMVLLNSDNPDANWGDWLPLTLESGCVEKCTLVIFDNGRKEKVFHATDITPMLSTDIVPIAYQNSRWKRRLINNFEAAFKDNYRNENPERLHPKKHYLTYDEVIDKVWSDKYRQLMGFRSYNKVYYAIRSEGYVINQTTLTVECKRFKPCDIKVGGR